jgi:hypothetical protein
MVAQHPHQVPPSFTPNRPIVRQQSLSGLPVVGRYEGPAHRKLLPVIQGAPGPWIWVRTAMGRGYFLADGWEAL